LKEPTLASNNNSDPSYFSGPEFQPRAKIIPVAVEQGLRPPEAATPSAMDNLAMAASSSFPEVNDAEEEEGGLIWVVLFGWVMLLSVIANLILTLMVMGDKRKQNFVYMSHLFLFTVNIVEFGLLIFEFSAMGVEHQFVYGQPACVAYQTSLRTAPLIQSCTVLLLLYHTANKFSNNHNNNSNNNTNNHRNNDRKSELTRFGRVLLGLLFVAVVVSVPTIFAARIIRDGSKRFCEIDFFPVGETNPSLTGSQQKQQQSNQSVGLQQASISIFYLMYSSVMPYWLPLLVSLKPLCKLLSSRGGGAGRSASGKWSELDMTLSTVLSFFTFFFCHASLVFIRHTLDLIDVKLTSYHFNLIKVLQSVLWLLAYLWHFARPTFVIVMDQDLKSSLRCITASCRSAVNSCSRSSSSSEEQAHQQLRNHRQQLLQLPVRGEEQLTAAADVTAAAADDAEQATAVNNNSCTMVTSKLLVRHQNVKTCEEGCEEDELFATDNEMTERQTSSRELSQGSLRLGDL